MLECLDLTNKNMGDKPGEAPKAAVEPPKSAETNPPVSPSPEVAPQQPKRQETPEEQAVRLKKESKEKRNGAFLETMMESLGEGEINVLLVAAGIDWVTAYIKEMKPDFEFSAKCRAGIFARLGLTDPQAPAEPQTPAVPAEGTAPVVASADKTPEKKSEFTAEEIEQVAQTEKVEESHLSALTQVEMPKPTIEEWQAFQGTHPDFPADLKVEELSDPANKNALLTLTAWKLAKAKTGLDMSTPDGAKKAYLKFGWPDLADDILAYDKVAKTPAFAVPNGTDREAFVTACMTQAKAFADKLLPAPAANE